MFILTMVMIFYGGSTIQTTHIQVEYSSMEKCEAASRANTASLAKTEEGKVVMATCTAK